MKICMIIPNEEVKGGIAAVVNGYKKRGFQEKYQITYVESYCDGSKLKKIKKAMIAYLQYASLLWRDRPDVIHIHSSFGGSFYRKLPFIVFSQLCGVKIINHIHGAEFDKFYENAGEKKKKLVQKIYGLCDVMIALSEEWKERLKRIVEEDRIVVIENYCEIPELKEKKKRQILFLGELSRRKGCYDLAAIYKTITKEAGRIPFIVAGDGEKKEVEATFSEFEAGQVSFPGWVRGEEKEKLLRESEYFLFPSYNEGMPMAVLEAMAHGMAIVTTTVGGIPKLIESGEEGFLCEPGDTREMAQKLLLLLKDEKLKDQCEKNCRKKAVENYSIDQHMKRVEAVYDRFLK